MKRLFFIISLLLCLPLAAQQTYRARVVDAEMAISLYETGLYSAWDIHICEKSKTGTDAIAKDLWTTSLDCIVQGAIRNTYNNIPSAYDPFPDGSGWSSITWPPEINNFFEKKINKECKCSTYPYAKKSYEKLSNIDYSEKFVIALIHSSSSSGDFGTGIPNHYVQILGTNEDGSIKYWQWGVDTPFISNKSNCWGIYIIDK